MSKYKIIEQSMGTYEDPEQLLTGTFDQIRKNLEDLEKKYAEQEYFEFRIFFDFGIDSFYPVLLGKRPETDDEYKKRLELQREAKEMAIARRRKEYEKLKKEFGD